MGRQVLAIHHLWFGVVGRVLEEAGPLPASAIPLARGVVQECGPRQQSRGHCCGRDTLNVEGFEKPLSELPTMVENDVVGVQKVAEAR